MKIKRFENIETLRAWMIDSSGLIDRLIDAFNHDPIASSHHINLNLVSTLHDPQFGSSSHDHVFLFFDCESFT
jgi:hypothetical protein